MGRKELEATIIKCAAYVFNKDEASLSTADRFAEDLGGASILMVGLVSEIENELDVMVQLQTAVKCKTIGDLTDEVEKLL